MAYFRHPRTTQERRDATGLAADKCELRADVGVTIRPRRGIGPSLVTNWDDISVAARSDRSWKRFRRNKWR